MEMFQEARFPRDDDSEKFLKKFFAISALRKACNTIFEDLFWIHNKKSSSSSVPTPAAR